MTPVVCHWLLSDPLLVLSARPLLVFHKLPMSFSQIAYVCPLPFLERQASGGMQMITDVGRLSVFVRHDSGGMSLLADVNPLSVLERQASAGMRLIADVGLLSSDVCS